MHTKHTLNLIGIFNKCRKVRITGRHLLTFKRIIKSRLPFAGIIRSSPYSPRFQDKG